MPKNRPWRRTIVAAVATGVHVDVASVVVRIHWGVIAFAVATRVHRDPACERRSARTATPLRYGLRGRPCRAVSTVDFTGESPTQGEIHGDNIYEDGYPPQTEIFPSIIKPLKMSATRMFPRSPRYICTTEVLPKDWKSEGELFKQKIPQG